jgi:hypothetical protein
VFFFSWSSVTKLAIFFAAINSRGGTTNRRNLPKFAEIFLGFLAFLDPTKRIETRKGNPQGKLLSNLY